MDYFKYFGRTWIELPDGEQILMPDITKRIALKRLIKSDVGIMLDYTINDTDTPESIAYRLYNDSSLWWVVLIASQKYELDSWPSYEHHLEDEALRMFPETDIYKTMYYLDEQERVTDINAQRIQKNTPNGSASFFGITPVTYLDHVRNLNEKKRAIKLIDPALVGHLKVKMVEVLKNE